MAFKTQAEIYQALLDGKKIKRKTWRLGTYINLVEGRLTDEVGDDMEETRLFPPHEFLIYEEPKPKKKVTLYRYTYIATTSGLIQKTFWFEGSFGDYADNFSFVGKHLLTESKEVEYDDV